jgi:hypothetical protein
MSMQTLASKKGSKYIRKVAKFCCKLANFVGKLVGNFCQELATVI